MSKSMHAWSAIPVKAVTRPVWDFLDTSYRRRFRGW
jgi:hypothetical protein